MEFQDKSRTCINDAWFNRQLYYRLPTFSLSRYYCDLLLEFPAIYIPQILTKHRIINKSIPLKKKNSTESLSLHHISTNKYIYDKQILDRGGKQKHGGFNCLRNTEKQDQSAFPRNCGGIGGERKWRWRVDNRGWRWRIEGQSVIYGKSRGNPTIGDDPRRAPLSRAS